MKTAPKFAILERVYDEWSGLNRTILHMRWDEPHQMWCYLLAFEGARDEGWAPESDLREKTL